MDEAILQRVRRIYAAIAEAEETDPEKLRATVVRTDKMIGMFQDFRGGLTDAQLSNQAHSVIHNIANLRGHLTKWATRHEKDKTMVEDAIRTSPELQIIIDLSDNDKHGESRRDDGRSGKRPKLVRINRVMQLATNPEAGSTIIMTLRPDGTPRFFGDGTAKAIVTGDVVDIDENRIGDLYEIASKAVGTWEELLSEFDVATDSGGI